MGNLTLNGQTVLTQVGTNRPEFGLGSNFPVIGEQSSFTATFKYFTSGYQNESLSPFDTIDSPSAYFIRIGNLVSVFIQGIAVPVDAAALYVLTGLPYNISTNCKGAASVSECRGASFIYSTNIYTSDISGPYTAFSSGSDNISFNFTRTSQDYSGYIYYATASGSAFPDIQATYFTDDTTLITE